MKPDLEVVQIGRQESFKAWEHGYPFRTVRWHFHPEYELHYVVNTTGRYFVGDFIGSFVPGNLVMTGPNLPHNWVSDLPPGAEVPLRNRVVQFTEGFIGDAMRAAARARLPAARRSRKPPRPALPAETAGRVGADDRRAGRGPAASAGSSSSRRARRASPGARALATLTSASYLPDPSGFMSAGINEALAWINRQPDRALRRDRPRPRSPALTPGAFSRSFRRHTGMSLVQYVNRLRINLACQLLMGPKQTAGSPRSASRRASTTCRTSTASSWRRRA